MGNDHELDDYEETLEWLEATARGRWDDLSSEAWYLAANRLVDHDVDPAKAVSVLEIE